MKSNMSAKEAVLALYKTAASGMSKKAFKLEDLKTNFQNMNPGAKAAILAGLGGAGVGLASHLITPKDEDEDTRGRMLRNILTGAALGGLAGYGGHTLFEAAKNNGLGGAPAPAAGPDGKPKDDRSWWQRNAPEVGYSDLMVTGGLGTGAVATGAAINARRLGKGLARLGAESPEVENSIRKMMTNRGQWNEAAIQGSKGLTAARKAYHQSNNLGLLNTLKSYLPGRFGHAAREAQRAADKNLMMQLGYSIPAKGKGVAAAKATLDRLVRSHTANPRNIMNARAMKTLPKGKLGLLAAALVAAGVGTKLYTHQQNKGN